MSGKFKSTSSSTSPSTPYKPSRFKIDQSLLLTAEEIVSGGDEGIVPVEVPELVKGGRPGIILLRYPSASLIFQFGAGSSNTKPFDQQVFDLFAYCIVDMDGEPLFSTPEQVEQLAARMSTASFSMLRDKLFTMGGLSVVPKVVVGEEKVDGKTVDSDGDDIDSKLAELDGQLKDEAPALPNLERGEEIEKLDRESNNAMG